MMVQVSEKLALERAYYTTSSGVAHRWSSDETLQNAYADLCQRGGDIIANQIIDARNKGHMPSVKELYRTAARVRRAIAELSESPPNTYQSYGQPFASSWDSYMEDTLRRDKDRTDHFQQLESAHRRFDALFSPFFRDKPDAHRIYGEGYVVRFGMNEEEGWIELRINAPGLKEKIAHIRKYNNGTMKLVHAHLRDHDAIFSDADRYLNILDDLVKKSPPDHDAFWHEMGAISLDLFHITPLHAGNQTAALMVLAGITKAMGYEVIPRNAPLGHFAEAELTPYEQYKKEYGAQFIQPPAHRTPPEKPTEVDDSFISEAYRKMRARYSDIADPRERLAAYINAYRKLPVTSIKPVKITHLEVKDGNISVKIKPRAEQDVVNYNLDFVGHKDIINMLGLAPGLYQDKNSRIGDILSRTLKPGGQRR